MSTTVANVASGLNSVNECGSLKTVGELNNRHVEIAKFKGEFVLHKHDHEDELICELKGGHLLGCTTKRCPNVLTIFATSVRIVSEFALIADSGASRCCQVMNDRSDGGLIFACDRHVD